MKIPKQFNILGHVFNVVYDDSKMDAIDALGQLSVDFNTITLCKKSANKPLPKSSIEHTYLHEIVHLILKSMGEDELYKNEKFVDVFAGLLHQILTTSK